MFNVRAGYEFEVGLPQNVAYNVDDNKMLVPFLITMY